MAEQELNGLTLPAQTLDRHSAFKVGAGGAQRWLDTLHKANIEESLQRLYAAVEELNRVRCAPHDRFATLEKLRPLIHECKQSRHRLYLNKPVTLPAEARKAVDLCHRFNEELATGYSLVATDLANRFSVLKGGELATAIHRAITEYSRILLRQYQLYSTPGPGFWRSLHRLYALARHCGVTRRKVRDPVFGDGRLWQSYLRAIMLATIPPNQLSQHELSTVFHYLTEWSLKLQLKTDTASCVFAWSLDDDRPPVYRDLGERNRDNLGVDADALRRHLTMLERVAGERREEYIDEPDLHRNLIQHLLAVWSYMPERASERIDSSGTVSLCLGLFATHYFVAGRTPFSAYHATSDVASELKRNSSLSRKARDTWSKARSGESAERTSSNDASPKHMEHLEVETIDYSSADERAGQGSGSFKIYEVPLVNVSEGGYCVRWPSADTVRMQAGEVIGIQTDPNRPWKVGILRWINHVDSETSHIGIESLSTAADAYSARLVQLGVAIGHAYRALLLPPEPGVAGDSRLLVPRTVFKAKQTLELLQPSGRWLYLKLVQCVASTSAFNLYEVEPTELP